MTIRQWLLVMYYRIKYFFKKKEPDDDFTYPLF